MDSCSQPLVWPMTRTCLRWVCTACGRGRQRLGGLRGGAPLAEQRKWWRQHRRGRNYETGARELLENSDEPVYCGSGSIDVRPGVDALLGGFIVRGLCGHDAGHEGLRVAVVEREPAALHLDHDAMAFEEDVVGGVQGEFVFLRRVGGDGFGLREAGAIAAAEDFVGNHELVAGGVGFRPGLRGGIDGQTSESAIGVGRGLVGKDVDELDDPVAVRA